MLPALIKFGSFAWLVFMATRKEKPADPKPADPKPTPTTGGLTKPTRPDATTTGTVTQAPRPACRPPALGAIWLTCTVGGTTSQGDYDALYHEATKKLLAVVHNPTYQLDERADGGLDERVLVVGVPMTTASGDAYVKKLAGHESQPTFPLTYLG